MIAVIVRPGILFFLLAPRHMRSREGVPNFDKQYMAASVSHSSPDSLSPVVVSPGTHHASISAVKLYVTYAAHQHGRPILRRAHRHNVAASKDGPCQQPF